jgi:hypothetical protein
MSMPSELIRREHDKFKEGPSGETRVQSYTLFEPDSGSLDAFSRMRFSSPHTEFDAKQLFDNLPLYFDDQQTSGTATTSTFATLTANTTLQVASSTAGIRIRQTFRRFNYQPGKSQLAFFTGALVDQTVTAGITTRIGLFDSLNGLFFEHANATNSVVVRSNTTGTPTDTVYSQGAWNIDSLDGSSDINNPSGYNLDFTKDQIFWLDYEWLGIGRVRWGIFRDGRPVTIHSQDHTNVKAGPYMSTPNLPIRYEINNDGTGAQTSMRVGCQSVISEGAGTHKDAGTIRTISNNNTHVDANTGGVNYALLGIRLKSTHIGASVFPINVSITPITNDIIEWQLIINPVIGGTTTWSGLTNSACEFFTGATANTITGGTVEAGGYIASTKDGGSGGQAIESQLVIGSKIDGTVDTLVLAAKPIGSGALNADIVGSLTFRELA